MLKSKGNTKMKYVWSVRQGIPNRIEGYTTAHYKVKSVLYSSLRKIRNRVKEAIESGEIKSHNNWTQEHWNEDKTSCTVINSGGCSIFTFHKIEVK